MQDLPGKEIWRDFARLMENVPAAFAVTRGAANNIASANAAFRSLMAQPAESFIGRPVTESFDGRDTAALAAALDRVKQTGVGERDVRVESLSPDDTPWLLSVSPESSDATPDCLVIGVTAETSGDLTLDLQREVAERMLLSAVHEIDVAQAAEGSRERAEFVAAAGRRVASSVDERVTIREISNLSLPQLGAWCIVDMVGSDASMQRIAIVHPDPARQALAASLETRWAPRAGDPFGLPAVLGGAATVVIDRDIDGALESAAHDPQIFGVLLQLGIGPLLTVPLNARNRIIGAITFVGASRDHAYDDSDIAVASELGARSALALDNSQIHSDALASKRRAEISTKRYGALIEASSQIVWMTNPAGEFDSQQREWAAFTGQTFEQYAGNGWLDAIHPEDRESAASAWAQAVNARTICEIEYRIRRHDGVYRTFGVRAVPVLDNHGRVREWIGAETDITERKATEAERDRLFRAEIDARSEAESAQLNAEEANQSKSDFLAAMSHELRTPLNAIAGYVQLMDMGVHGPVTPAQRGALQRVKRSEEHLLSLINDVLNFAKVEAGHIAFDIEDVQVAEMLTDVESIVHSQIKLKDLALHVMTSAGIAVRADEEKFRQILLNLLSNAIKFTEPGGRIDIESIVEDGSSGEGTAPARIRVSDTGIGIAFDKQDSVFDPFVQVHRNLRHPTEGTGLGLAISRNLARSMGGDLRVSSVDGKGSTFTLTLPLANGSRT